MTTTPQQPRLGDWQRLGKAIEDRRFERGLSQEALVKRGGPSHQTVRNVERGVAADYRPTTYRKFDLALDWPDGTTKKILDGTATEADIKAVVPRAMGSTEEIDTAGAASAQLGRLTARASGFENTATTLGGLSATAAERKRFTAPRGAGISLGEMIERMERGDEEAIEAMRPILSAAQAVAAQAAQPALAALRESLRPSVDGMNASVLQAIRPALDELHGSVMRSFALDIAPAMPGISALLRDIVGPNSAFGAIAGVAKSLQLQNETSMKLALRNLGSISAAAAPIDVSGLLGLPDNLRALAIPPADPERVALWEEFDRKADAIAKEPWFDEESDVTIEEALRRYNEAHPKEPVVAHRHAEHHETSRDKTAVDVGASANTATATTTGLAHNPTATTVDEVEESLLPEVIPGRWGAVFVAQQDVGDVKDTALVAELLARVSRLPDSDERRMQLRVLNSLFEELLDDQETHQLAPRPNHMRRLEHVHHPR